MRLFGKKKDKKTAQGNPMETRMAQQEAYFEIVKQIAPDDPEVLLALREGFPPRSICGSLSGAFAERILARAGESAGVCPRSMVADA